MKGAAAHSYCRLGTESFTCISASTEKLTSSLCSGSDLLEDEGLHRAAGGVIGFVGQPVAPGLGAKNDRLVLGRPRVILNTTSSPLNALSRMAGASYSAVFWFLLSDRKSPKASQPAAQNIRMKTMTMKIMNPRGEADSGPPVWPIALLGG